MPRFRTVTCRGLLGTYDDGREWLKGPGRVERSKCILSLGSSIGMTSLEPLPWTRLTSSAGNFDRDAAGDFLKGFADTLGPTDMMLIGVDACTDPAKV